MSDTEHGIDSTPDGYVYRLTYSSFLKADDEMHFTGLYDVEFYGKNLEIIRAFAHDLASSDSANVRIRRRIPGPPWEDVPW